MDLSRDQLSIWLQRYFDAWVSNDPAAVSSLFSADAVYHYGPFREPARGREAIVRNWTANPEQQSAVVCHFEPLAVDGSLGIAHWSVSYQKESGAQHADLDGILVLRFNYQLECEEHHEWYSYSERDR